MTMIAKAPRARKRKSRAPSERTPTDLRPFPIRDCALIAIATGQRARDVSEMARTIEQVHPASIYYHFWGGLLRPKFVDPEYRNDFAIWTRNDLHDEVLAERLAALDPTQHQSLEGLRSALLEAFGTASVEPKRVGDEPFYFVRSQVVVFDTGRRVSTPERLAQALPRLSLGSIFYHFIDARRRNDGHLDDFTQWLADDERHVRARERLRAVDYYFVSLSELRAELTSVLGSCFGKASMRGAPK